MLLTNVFRFKTIAALLAFGLASSISLAFSQVTPAPQSAVVAVGPQYDSTHVYVSPEDFDRFIASFIATFGGTASKQSLVTVTPTPSQALSELVMTPVGIISVFGFKTPIPFPFGSERTGYLVSDLDAAIRSARASGADVLVGSFADAIGRDAVVQWPGGVNMQLYWHSTAPSYAPLQTIPENRVYLSVDRVNEFVRSVLSFSQGSLVSDDAHAPGVEVGRPGDTFRRIRIQSKFGRLAVFVTDGHLPYPYGRETTGYEVADLVGTLSKAQSAGAVILVAPYEADRRHAAIVQFPGGFIAEIHSESAK